MVSIYLKWYCHEVRPELGYRPHDSQALQFSGGVGFFSLVEGPGSATDDALLAIADLSQDRTEASGGGVGIEPEPWLKSGKAVMGLVVSRCFSWSKAAWHSALQ